MEEKLDIETIDIWIECANQVCKKKTGPERQIVVQFNSYKNKLDILRNCKKLKGTNFMDFSKETTSIRKEKMGRSTKKSKGWQNFLLTI